jgi:hypothetical protein
LLLDAHDRLGRRLRILGERDGAVPERLNESGIAGTA